jgi:hypothetical protein
MEEPEILEEMGKVMDQFAGLPSDAFAARVALQDRQAELRRLLAEAQAKAGREVPEDWAEQAARSRPPDAKQFIEIHLPDSSGSGG